MAELPLSERLRALRDSPYADAIAHHLEAIDRRVTAAERRYLASGDVSRRIERAARAEQAAA